MYYTVIKHSSHLRTLGKCRKHSPAARAFYISLVFSNACRVLSQCKTRLRLLYLLNKRPRRDGSYKIYQHQEKYILDVKYKEINFVLTKFIAQRHLRDGHKKIH